MTLSNRVPFLHAAAAHTRMLTGEMPDQTQPFAAHLVPGRILAVESYAGSVPTFTWASDRGHVFAYLPPWAFQVEDDRPAPLVDFVCPGGSIAAHDFGFEGGGWGRIGETALAWKRYLLTVDWVDQNKMAHLCLTLAGNLAWFRNSRFQVGGYQWDPPKGWQKARGVHRLGGPPTLLEDPAGRTTV